MGSFIASVRLKSGHPLCPLAATSGPVQACHSIILPVARWVGREGMAFAIEGKSGVDVVLGVSVLRGEEKALSFS